jgi:hypothetical protein
MVRIDNVDWQVAGDRVAVKSGPDEISKRGPVVGRIRRRVHTDESEMAIRDTFFDHEALLQTPRSLTNREQHEHPGTSEQFVGRVTRSSHLEKLQPTEKTNLLKRSSGRAQ